MLILEKLSHYAGTERTAFLYGEQSLSYAELERRSNAFAAFLLRRFGDDRTPILIYGHKDLSIPACMFGALKAGRGYVPVDISFPPERVRQIAEELQPKLVVDLHGAGLEGVETLTASDLEAILSSPAEPVDPSLWLRPEQVAYILFTSGSTGRPKGVQITAGNIAAFLEGVAPWFGEWPEGSVFLNEISYSFDVSVCALYYALSRGMTLYTVDKETLDNPKRLFEALAASHVQFWVSTPSLAELCVQSERFGEALLPEVSRFVFCGEVMTQKLTSQMRQRFPRAAILNAYGPTEATVLVTAAVLKDELLTEPTVPIGYAFDNVTARIADAEGGELGEGEAGELLLIGKSVSPGYFKRPELNEKAFFTDPVTGERGYHTGDLCYQKGGCIYYCGRLDNQVKLNGFRVELEDVENNLAKVSNVSRAAVLPVMTDGKITSLTAFVLLEKADGLSALKRAQKIRQELGAFLPSYMIPRKIVALDALPLNTNGKVDKKALAAML